MWLEILAISLWGGIVALDTTAAFQFMISHPIISSSVVGLILGNFPVGFIIGIVLELIWLSELPIGAAKFAQGNIGATNAAAIAILTIEQTSRTTPSVAFALISSIIISTVGGQLVVLMRNMNSKIYDHILSIDNLTFRDVTKAHLTGVVLAFSLGFLLTLVSLILFAVILLPGLINRWPESADRFLRPIAGGFFGVGCGILTYLFINHKKWWLLFVGLAGGFFIYFT
jgi:PTS system mannose-specific IIC component